MPLVSLSSSISQNCLLNDDTVTGWLKHIIINTSRWKWNTSTFLRKHSLPRMKPKSIQIFVSFYLSWEVWHHAAELNGDKKGCACDVIESNISKKNAIGYGRPVEIHTNCIPTWCLHGRWRMWCPISYQYFIWTLDLDLFWRHPDYPEQKGFSMLSFIL